MELNDITHAIIGAAMKVHRALGPGLLESAYEVCLAYELVAVGFVEGGAQGEKFVQRQPE